MVDISKPSGYITKDTHWQKWRSWVYGAPGTVHLPGNMPTAQACADEPQGAAEVRSDVISGDEDDLEQQVDKADVGSEVGLCGEREEEFELPDM